MSAKYRICRIFKISVRIVAIFFKHNFCIMTFTVTVRSAYQLSNALGVAYDLRLISTHFRHWCASLYNGKFARYLRLWHFKCEAVIRLKKNGLCVSKSLSDGTICCLTEVAALSVFKVRSSRNERYFHICNRRACENAKILFLLQMGKNKSLPVFVQRIFTAFGCKTQTLATLQRLKL